MTFYKTRRKFKRAATISLLVLGFLILWCLFTLVILALQDAFLTESTEIRRSDTESNRGVRVVVGHYNGNLPQEKLRNLTDEDLNSNNYSPIDGWGDNGAPVRLARDEERIAEETWPINQFNLYVSDRISINRSLPDVRKPSCRDVKYPEVGELPSTSIIIVYHNEAYSTLLRTVWSVVNRSPRQLLEEIILVDDFSNRTFLRQPLDEAMKRVPVHVKIIRSRERVGLIRARMMGAQEANGAVLTFLDSHCECTEGWLEPLLARIKENRKNVVCPVIDVINDNSFQYQKGIELFRGGFNWNLQFRWYSMPASMINERTKDPVSPISSPTMAGGLFSIDRTYFEDLGAYDAGMDIWGGENLEMSFRIWQCGGRVEILPCSHVGHVFRKSSPHDFPGKSSGKVLNANLFRAAEVWMDDWKMLFYKMAPQAAHLRAQMDLSERIELRKKLNCRSFKWYLENVFTDHFLPMEGEFFGRIASKNETCISWHLNSSSLKKANMENCTNTFEHQQIDSQGLCIVSRPGDPGKGKHRLLLQSCTLGFDLWQLWLYTRDGRIRSDEHMCLSASQVVHTNGEWTVQLKECAGYEHEYWRYDRRRSRFVHKQSGLCLSQPLLKGAGDESNTPVVQSCGSSQQTFILREVDWRQLD